MTETVTNINGIKVSFRSPEPADINFILSTMLKGLFYGSKFWGEVDQEAFFSNYEPFVKQLMLKSTIQVACLDDDKDVILGWSMFDVKGETCHFVFVKKSYRKLGIGTLLFPYGCRTVSHVTDQGNSIRKRKNLKFNPFNV